MISRDEIIKDVENWTDEKTEICANISVEFMDYYDKLSNIVDDTFNQFYNKDANMSFLGIVSGLAETIMLGVTEKDVKYYALIAVIKDTITIYQSDI